MAGNRTVRRPDDGTARAACDTAWSNANGPSVRHPPDFEDSCITLYELSLQLESLVEEQAGQNGTVTIPAQPGRMLVPLIELTAGYALDRAEHSDSVRRGDRKRRKKLAQRPRPVKPVFRPDDMHQ